VRGLFALMILERLMEAVNLDAPPKPCDYFDMIGRDEHRRVSDRTSDAISV
jgi:hypothetical protein